MGGKNKTFLSVKIALMCVYVWLHSFNETYAHTCTQAGPEHQEGYKFRVCVNRVGRPSQLKIKCLNFLMTFLSISTNE